VRRHDAAHGQLLHLHELREQHRLRVGTGGPDQIYGGGGHDTLDRGGGKDYIDGQGGPDLILGRAGNDGIFGQRQPEITRDAGSQLTWLRAF
jgi:Ca2+-binding RTX toxin-like protein